MRCQIECIHFIGLFEGDCLNRAKVAITLKTNLVGF